MEELYPVNKIDNKKIEALVDPETGEILDDEMAENFFSEKKTEEKVKTNINKVKTEKIVIESIKEEIERLKKIIKTRENRVKSFKHFILIMLRSWDKKSIKFEASGATRVLNEGTLQLDEGADVKKYTKVEMVEKVDKNAIKADLKSGKKIKGCWIDRKERVDIK
jgi:hypothetical protein